jgi:hypothetical protein
MPVIVNSPIKLGDGSLGFVFEVTKTDETDTAIYNAAVELENSLSSSSQE